MPFKKKVIPVLIVFLLLSTATGSLSPVLADWNYDTTPPTFSTNPPAGAYPPGGLPQLSIEGKDLSGISSLSATVTSGTFSPSQCICTPAGSCSVTGSTGTGNCSYTSTLITPWDPPLGTYNFTITVKDQAGNTGGGNPAFTVSNAANPWIQTTGGDVHSNSNIYAPAGP